MPIVSHHRVVTPSSLSEALAFLKERAGEGWRPLAGGTDIMVSVNAGHDAGSRWLDLSRIRGELSGIEFEDGTIRIGGLTTMTALRRSPLCRDACPMIAAAAATVGANQIQNRATVAGNIVNASPAGDTLPVWLALEAEVELASTAGTRRVPYREFTTAYRRTVRKSDELLTAVRFTPLERWGTRLLFRKVGTRAAQAISKVVLAAVAVGVPGRPPKDVRLAFGSMAPTPVRAVRAEEAALRGESPSAVATALEADLSPIDDVRSTASYRMRVARSLVREFLAGNLGSESLA